MHANEENLLVPMGALTGKPDRKMISETLSALKEVGITQYLLYPVPAASWNISARNGSTPAAFFWKRGNVSASPPSGSTTSLTGQADSAVEKS